MLSDLCQQWSAWWSSVTPEFAFLLALPFAVAALGLAAEAWRCWRGKR